jgi:hypothetical protein
MISDGYDTPEEAMMVGFPPRYCRVVASAINGDLAYVLLDTGSDGNPYLYGGWCHRIDGRWLEGSSSNMGGGWEGEEDRNGNQADWGEAPTGAEALRFDLNGVHLEVPVQHGAYLAVFWDVPCGDVPRMVAVKINGEWRGREPRR